MPTTNRLIIRDNKVEARAENPSIEIRSRAPPPPQPLDTCVAPVAKQRAKMARRSTIESANIGLFNIGIADYLTPATRSAPEQWLRALEGRAIPEKWD
jgi:hypothetical protein